MSTLFSTCLLFQEDSRDLQFKTASVRLQPGQGFSPGQDQSAILAGGFPSVLPECEIPLSPTLQLNFDLTNSDTSQLERIAHAELHRKNSVNYRSYTVNMDNRAAVIGSDAGQLKTFINTYGGILELHPLLLKGYDPELTTVTSLNIDAHGESCRLDYQVRSPIDFAKCTYCGECGPGCPEDAISAQLFVNYDRCTLCRDCEKVCAANAIDIHSVLEKVLEVPAVIVLGELKLDLAKGSDHVFYEDQLADFFATVYPSQVDELVSCDNSICQFSGRLGKGCDLCLSSCRYGAITADSKGISVSALQCEDCGACVAVCPTGALQNERFNDVSFVDYFKEVSIPEDGCVVIGDSDELHDLWWRSKSSRWDGIFFLQYENPRTLSLFHFLFLLNRGARRIILVEKGAQGGFGVNKQIDLASEIIAKLYDIDDVILRCDPASFAQTVTQQVNGSLGRKEEGKEFSNRRQAMAEALAGLVSRSGREVSLSPGGYIPFATVSCDSTLCTECLACLHDCRIGAMAADQKQLILSHKGALCVACGLCVRICPENALSISPEFTLAAPFFTDTELARAEPMACKTCGKVFGTRKSFDKVMAILQQKESVDTSHFEYCETCRVVNLFQAE